jgi:hypothetical protein
MKYYIPNTEQKMKYYIPNTEQKIRIYSQALELLLGDINNKRRRIGGFCYYISSVCIELFPKIEDRPVFNLQHYDSIDLRIISKQCFPELFKYEPKAYVFGNRKGLRSIQEFWFNTYRGQGAKKRVQILQTEIELLRQQL